MKRAVIRVDRSPMNPDRWCLTLECGHETWIGAVRRASQQPRRPTAKTANCAGCQWTPPDPTGSAR